MTTKPADVARRIEKWVRNEERLGSLIANDMVVCANDMRALARVVLAAHEYVNGKDPDSFDDLARALAGEA